MKTTFSYHYIFSIPYFIMDMYEGGSCMTNNDQPEVIDPNDPRYKDDDYFKHSPSEHQRSRFEQDRNCLLYTSPSPRDRG